MINSTAVVCNLGSRTTRTVAHQLFKGIKAIHDAGYCHRDLKPETILLDENFNVKIKGMELTRKYKENEEIVIKMSTICGTRGYLAPELIRGEQYDHKVDLFAAGIIIFTTFAGCKYVACSFFVYQ